MLLIASARAAVVAPDRHGDRNCPHAIATASHQFDLGAHSCIAAAHLLPVPTNGLPPLAAARPQFENWTPSAETLTEYGNGHWVVAGLALSRCAVLFCSVAFSP